MLRAFGLEKQKNCNYQDTPQVDIAGEEMCHDKGEGKAADALYIQSCDRGDISLGQRV